jgi:hypothetical protein
MDSTGAEVVHWRGFDSSDVAKTKKRANARLIAAAPELLDALNSFPMLLAPATTAWSRQVQDWQEKALAAIAKATGGAA